MKKKRRWWRRNLFRSRYGSFIFNMLFFKGDKDIEQAKDGSMGKVFAPIVVRTRVQIPRTHIHTEQVILAFGR